MGPLIRAALRPFGDPSVRTASSVKRCRCELFDQLLATKRRGTPNDFNVTFDGNSVFAQSNIASSSYTKFTVNGIASTASTVIQFGFRDDPGFLHLDDTNVEAVPEPGTLALLGAGVVAFGASRRRRKSR